MDEIISIGVILFLAALAFYALIMLALASAVLAIIGLGLFCIIIAKSKRAIVRDENAFTAVISSIAWSGALTVGCVIGSFGLYIAMNYASNGSLDVEFTKKYGDAHSFLGIFLVLEKWLLLDAYSFFAKVAVVIFLANRIFVARASGGKALLGAIPPLLGLTLFFLSEHWQSVRSIIYEGMWTEFASLAGALYDDIRLPIDLAVRALSDPKYVAEWSAQQLRNSNASFFRLSHLFPTFFFIIAFALMIGSIRESLSVDPA